MNLIDKCLLKFFGYIDDFAPLMDILFFPKSKKKDLTGKKIDHQILQVLKKLIYQ